MQKSHWARRPPQLEAGYVGDQWVRLDPDEAAPFGSCASSTGGNAGERVEHRASRGGRDLIKRRVQGFNGEASWVTEPAIERRLGVGSVFAAGLQFDHGRELMTMVNQLIIEPCVKG